MRARIELFDRGYFGSYLEGAAAWARSRGREVSREESTIAGIDGDAALLYQMRPTSVLDFGCGRGELMARLAVLSLRDNHPLTCHGYDPAPISAAYRELTFAEFEVESICHGTNSDFTLPDKAFDLVVARNLFECLDPEAIPRSPDAEVRRTMAKLRALCREGGRIAIKSWWNAPDWDRMTWERAYQAWKAAGPARDLVPWSTIDGEGRLNGEGETLSNLYEKLTVVNPWTKDPAQLAAHYFPGLASVFDPATGWLVVER